MSQDEFRAPAGWYPDPLGHPQLRWWNAFGWTEQTSAAPETVVIPQQPRYAWKEDEPVVIPVQTHATYAPTPPRAPVSTTLHEIEAPRAQARVEEPSSFTIEKWQALQDAPATPAAPAAAPAALAMPAAPAPAALSMPAAPVAPAIAAPVAEPVAAPVAQTPPPPAFWDDYEAQPQPSVLPEDLKFWSGSSPAELRRLAREQAERENQG